MAIPARDHRRELLRPDCDNCFAVCCVALSFTRSVDFAVDKPAGEPCINLRADFACGIHERLGSSGFRGCTVFECFGAGQQVSQTTFGGVSWADQPHSREQMFAVFPVMRDLHELLWYLSEAQELEIPSELAKRVRDSYESISGLTRLTADQLRDLDIGPHREAASELLAQVSRRVRSVVPETPRQLRTVRGVGPRADLIGTDLSHADLRGADLRGTYLIGADLSGSDLTGADLIGSDLRDARLDASDLSLALFLTQPQVNSATGDGQTRLPRGILRPEHWG